MRFDREYKFVLDYLKVDFVQGHKLAADYLEAGLDCKVYDGKQITPELIDQVKKGIAQGRVCNITAMSADGMEGDSFNIEFDIDDQEKGWMDIEIIFTDMEGVEHSFLYYNEKYAQESEEEEEEIAFGQDIRWISSLSDDFGLAAEIFGKWVLTGELYPRPWRHQWREGGEDHYEIYGLECASV